MTDLVLHDATRTQLENYLARPVQAILIAGPDGIGKTAIAEALLTALLTLTPDQLRNHPQFMRIAPEGSTISIEAIRGLQKFMQLKTIGSAAFRRALLIEHAQALTTEAQNAYLKLLEEPPADTVMILTADSPRSLLPTILSRLQTITVYPPSEELLQPLLQAASKDQATLRQAYFLSGGLPGLLSALISGDEAHPLLAGVAAAKDLLQKQPFERLALADQLSKQKETAGHVLEALERMASAGLDGAAAKSDPAKLKQWHRIRKQAAVAKNQLAASANAKLTLTNLFLHL